MGILAALLILWGGMLLYTWPMARAFHLGVQAAHNPDARLTPISPWRFFLRRAWKAVRWWIPLWLLWLAVMVVAGWAQVARNADGVTQVAQAMMLAAFVSTAFFFGFANCVWWANRIRNSAFLGVVVALLAVVQTVITFFLVKAVVPLPLRHYSWTNAAGNMSYGTELSIYWGWVLAAAVAMLALWWLRRQGERWFRFEE